MKESQISDALRESMNAVRLSPALRARALCAMRGSEERRPKMKRKFSAALAFALVGVLIVAVALAVANRKGVLDFLSYPEATLPENAGDYVQTDIASDERDGCMPWCEKSFTTATGCGRRWISTWTAKSRCLRVLITAWTTRKNGRG